MTAARAHQFLEKGVLYALMCGKYPPVLRELRCDLDTAMPLIVPSGSAMSEEAQRNLAAFVERGGKLLIAPMIPGFDRDGAPAETILTMLGVELVRRSTQSPVTVVRGRRVYGLKGDFCFNRLPAGAEAVAHDDRTGECLGFSAPVGRGRVIALSVDFILTYFFAGGDAGGAARRAFRPARPSARQP